ncbi:hypothetical protein N5C55_27240 [Pseudomonas otitidis]|nr:hypothetical protein [Pseudomonas otitidis]MDH0334789.1 hypothetical protein [Pseudomonas otitidis]MDH1110076.1 hypothetical protein [Pseudomonas otitidis]MDH1161886.1 hypothetical protein [Pseudomonas otitidis]MDH1167841.1 hypothetical protein [Pseudomonas otitidis]
MKPADKDKAGITLEALAKQRRVFLQASTGICEVCEAAKRAKEAK